MDRDREREVIEGTFESLEERIAIARRQATRLQGELSAVQTRIQEAVDALRLLKRNYPQYVPADAGTVNGHPITFSEGLPPITRRVTTRGGAPTGRVLARAFLEAHSGEWFSVAEVVEALVEAGSLAGSVLGNMNKIRIAILKDEKAGVIERQDHKYERNAYRYRIPRTTAALAPGPGTPSSTLALVERSESTG